MFVIIKTSAIESGVNFNNKDGFHMAATEAQAEQVAMELAAREGATYTILEPIQKCVFRAVTELQAVPTQRVQPL